MIKRYFATKDNTITDAYQSDMVTRGTGSNMGQSDILEAFTIYGQLSSSSGFSREISNILLQFDATQIGSDKTNGYISSGSTFYLKLYNCKHSQPLPRDYSMQIVNLTQHWQEGLGLDMENYSDLTYDIRGSNWIRRSGSVSWTTAGSTSGSMVYTTTFPEGDEDLEVDITDLVNRWIDNDTVENHGVAIKIASSLALEKRSYYTKKFFGRASHNWFERPVIEARWDSAKTDDRGAFYVSSSLVSAEDNINTIYLYNYARGRLRNIPSLEGGDNERKIYVSLFSGSSGPTAAALTLVSDGTHVQESNNQVVTGGWVSTGIYSASCAISAVSTLTNVYDVWFSGSNAITASTDASVQFSTGSITLKRFDSLKYSYTPKYVFAVSNRNQDYYYNQTHRIRLYAREKDWSPNIYTTAITVPSSLVFESASYQIYRVTDSKVVIPYDTGSNQATRLSYDVSGNYFDLDCTMLEPNYQYGVKFSIYDPDTLTYEEQPFIYNLRVVKNES